ncbi:hypothetical protein JTE88_04310 [Arcanobacterium phocisimile]|uniref:Primosomal protein N' 3' DNA-binding domain-containing protein n=1 Tax=Arcanobacterium phocisimile TaxID=1302235 RepID=A0ABX7IMC2_9ACTO|nr:hypothetical protein [Arcanobacterium phocisimile]QRV02948.1 hypothetical protein JTE88_04310 [Arcanobacterium phocisimile]
MNELFSLPEYAHQDQLLNIEPVSARVKSAVPLPVARIVVDVPHMHMGSLFDYEVPEKFADVAVGARVMVDLGSQRVQGFIVERVESTAFHATLRPIQRVVSPIPVLDERIYELAQVVACRQSSTVASCLRLAIPQRHARAEREFLEVPAVSHQPIERPEVSQWQPYAGGKELVEQLCAGASERAVVQVRSIDSILELSSSLIQATMHSGRNVIFVVPTVRQAESYAQELTRRLGVQVSLLLSEHAPDVRYRQFLDIKSGNSRVIVGTRHAAWAPAQNLGLVLLVDDQHKSLIEQRNPYIHARDLLRERSVIDQCAMVCLNFGPSVELSYDTQHDARAVVPANPRDKHALAQVVTAASLAYEGEPWSRMPSSVFTIIRSGLERGDVLVTVPRSGYIPVVACVRCREIATCPTCDGRLGYYAPDKPAQCSRCGIVVDHFTCKHCRGHQLKPVRIGSHRTAQEIGRAFRGVPIHIGGFQTEISPSGDENAIIIATPGQIPKRPERYAAAVVLDAGFLLRSENLNTEVYFLRALAHICATVQPHSAGGQVLIVGDVPPALTLVVKHWDMHGWALKALRERQELGLPPVNVWVRIAGTRAVLRSYLGIVQSLAREAQLEVPEQSPVSLLSAGASEIVPGMRVIGPFEHDAEEETELYLSFPNTARELMTSIISQAQHIFSVQRMGKLQIKMDTTV